MNFKENKHEILSAANNGSNDDTEWQFIFKENVDIENFHIKNAIIIEDRIVLFARGKPRNVIEQCCSFLLSFKLRIGPNGLVCGFDPAYNYIKLNELTYAEFLLKPIVSKQKDDVIIRMTQEHNYTESFPR